MILRPTIALLALLVAGACADADEAAHSDDTDAAAAETRATDTPAGEAGPPEAVRPGELLHVNEASAADLRAAGLPDAAVAAITAGRPFDDMLAVDAALEGVLDESGREAAYRATWIPIDLNTATREEMLLIPGVGERMAHEFEEYRPYEAMAEFSREIGKYVDDDEVERLARYVTLR